MSPGLWSSCRNEALSPLSTSPEAPAPQPLRASLLGSVSVNVLPLVSVLLWLVAVTQLCSRFIHGGASVRIPSLVQAESCPCMDSPHLVLHSPVGRHLGCSPLSAACHTTVHVQNSDTAAETEMYGPESKSCSIFASIPHPPGRGLAPDACRGNSRECTSVHYCPRLCMAELSGTEGGGTAAEPDALTIHHQTGACPSLLRDSTQAFPLQVITHRALGDLALLARNNSSMDGCNPSSRISCCWIEH